MEIALDILIFLAVGLVAGWLGSIFVRGRGFGLIGNLVVGILGALIGGFVFRGLGIAPGNVLGELIAATIGAVILLVIIRLIKRA